MSKVCQHLYFTDDKDGAVCVDCGAADLRPVLCSVCEWAGAVKDGFCDQCYADEKCGKYEL